MLNVNPHTQTQCMAYVTSALLCYTFRPIQPCGLATTSIICTSLNSHTAPLTANSVYSVQPSSFNSLPHMPMPSNALVSATGYVNLWIFSLFAATQQCLSLCTLMFCSLSKHVYWHCATLSAGSSTLLRHTNVIRIIPIKVFSLA